MGIMSDQPHKIGSIKTVSVGMVYAGRRAIASVAFTPDAIAAAFGYLSHATHVEEIGDAPRVKRRDDDDVAGRVVEFHNGRGLSLRESRLDIFPFAGSLAM